MPFDVTTSLYVFVAYQMFLQIQSLKDHSKASVEFLMGGVHHLSSIIGSDFRLVVFWGGEEEVKQKNSLKNFKMFVGCTHSRLFPW